jgi:hypothetical protein
LKHELRFVASMSIRPSDIKNIRRHVEMAQASIDPLRNVLITPPFVSKESLELVRQMAEEGRFVMFDSGGYYVQLGRVRYEELYVPLMKAYDCNRWASVYTLPDHVPKSQDPPDVVDAKVKDTIRVSQLFFEEMPDELKPLAMPVVHGYTYEQVDACLQTYVNMGVKYVGFGSFGTQGQKSQRNVVTPKSLELVQHTINVAHSHKIKVHLFGLGAPPYVAMLKGIGADSFDSGSWQVSAGYGQVSLPFMRYYHISQRHRTSQFHRVILPNEFEVLKKITTHRCALCDDLPALQNNKMHRAVHNLIVMEEAVNMVNHGDRELIQTIYKSGSPRYRMEFEKWLGENPAPRRNLMLPFVDL